MLGERIQVELVLGMGPQELKAPPIYKAKSHGVKVESKGKFTTT
jgi:hypothetical protein